LANFYDIFEKVLQNEGFYSNDPQDSGGETYAGVSRKHNPDWEGWRWIDGYKKDNGGKIRHNFRIPSIILDSLVEEVYRAKYWRPMKGNLIGSDWVAATFFDMYINAGTKAVRLMQLALNSLGLCLEVDSIMGPKTLNAINLVDPEKLVKAYNEERARYYKNLVIAKPSNLKYLHGWLARTHRFDKWP
jgi:lysozyme family protein